MAVWSELLSPCGPRSSRTPNESAHSVRKRDAQDTASGCAYCVAMRLQCGFPLGRPLWPW